MKVKHVMLLLMDADPEMEVFRPATGGDNYVAIQDVSLEEFCSGPNGYRPCYANSCTIERRTKGVRIQ